MNNQLVDLWWYRLPVIANRISQTISVALADGFYLTAWSKVGAFAPPTVLLVGFLIGWLHPGNTFTFSIMLMAVMMSIGSFGAGLGAWTWIGYALGNFILFSHPEQRDWLETIIQIRIPLLLSYLLLVQLLVLIPLAAQALRQSTLPRLRIQGKTVGVAGIFLESILQGLLQSSLVYVWINTVPTLIRPVYTWQGQRPPVAAIQPLQSNGIVLVILAVILGIARIILEYRALKYLQVQEQALKLQATLNKSKSLDDSLPSFFLTIFKAVFATFMLSGLLANQIEGIILCSTILALMIVRRQLRTRMGGWIDFISRFPLIFRLMFAALINYWVAGKIIEAMWRSTSTFLPITISVIASIIIFSLIIPKPRTKTQSKVAGGLS